MNPQIKQPINTLPPLSEEFLTKIYTKKDAIKAIRILKEYLNFAFFNFSKQASEKEINFSQAFAEFEVKSMSRISNQYISDVLRILRLFDNNFFKKFQMTKLNQQFADLETSVNATKTFILHLPFEVPDNEIVRLGNWIKANLGATTLFDINFDPSLIGGCAFSFKGNYKDYSLRQKILQDKSQLMKILLTFKTQ